MTPNMQRRLAITSRIMAGALGGYVLTSLIAVALFLLLRSRGMAKDEALLAPALGSFVVYAAIVMAVFHARSATRAWLWLVGASIPLGLVLAVVMRGINGA